MKYFLYVIWFLFAIGGVNTSFALVSAANSFSNILGLFLLVAVILISIKTKCFGNLTFKK